MVSKLTLWEYILECVLSFYYQDFAFINLAVFMIYRNDDIEKYLIAACFVV